MNEEVKFIGGKDRINRTAQRPSIAAEVADTLAAACRATGTRRSRSVPCGVPKTRPLCVGLGFYAARS